MDVNKLTAETGTDENSAIAAAEEFKQIMRAENPVFAARCEVNAHDIIAQYKGTESGRVFLLYLALSISAASEKGEL